MYSPSAETVGLGAPAIVVQCIGKREDGKNCYDTDEDGEELPAFADVFVVNHDLGSTRSNQRRRRSAMTATAATEAASDGAGMPPPPLSPSPPPPALLTVTTRESVALKPSSSVTRSVTV